MQKAELDPEAVKRLQAQVAADFAGALTSALAYLGDRLGLFAALSDGKPRTPDVLATETGLVERYVREWASALAVSGYLAYDAAARTFRMTAEQVAFLADRESPLYAGGTYLYAQACTRQLTALMEAFQRGGGVDFGRFGPEISEAIEKLYANSYRDGVESWIAAVPELAARLERGGRVADVGCGGGRALLAVVARFPASKGTGVDLDAPSLERARAAAASRGLESRARFQQLAAEDLPERTFDLVTAFNCIHDMQHPDAALRGIRRSLASDGFFLWSEAPVSDELAENTGTFSRLVYAASCMHCMTVSLAGGGAGLGTAIGERTVRELATGAGFSSCDVLPVRHPQHRIYVLRP